LHTRHRQAAAFNREVALKTLVNGRSTKLVNIQSMKMVKKVLPGSVSLRDRWERHISRHSGRAKARTTMLNCASGNPEIPGSMLRIAPE
jgi:hypothetical protein